MEIKFFTQLRKKEEKKKRKKKLQMQFYTTISIE